MIFHFSLFWKLVHNSSKSVMGLLLSVHNSQRIVCVVNTNKKLKKEKQNITKKFGCKTFVTSHTSPKRTLDKSDPCSSTFNMITKPGVPSRPSLESWSPMQLCSRYTCWNYITRKMEEMSLINLPNSFKFMSSNRQIPIIQFTTSAKSPKTCIFLSFLSRVMRRRVLRARNSTLLLVPWNAWLKKDV